MRFFLLLAALALATCGGSDKPGPVYSGPLFQFAPGHAQALNNSMFVSTEPCDKGTCYKVTYLPVDPGTPRITKGFKLRKETMYAKLTYDFRSTAFFEYTKGGKLHGFSSADTPEAGGGTPVPGSWSCRAVWHSDGSVRTYAYHQAQTREYGDIGPLLVNNNVFDGQWHRVAVEVSVGNYCRVSVDGTIVSEQRPFVTRAPVDKFWFVTFFGGSTPDYTPSSTQTAWFANFVVR